LIRPVDTSLLDAVTKTGGTSPAQSAASETAGKKAFSAELKRAAEKTTDTKPATDPAATATVLERTTPPEGEKWRPVKGHDDYAEIVAGDRKGQFVNLNRGARRGDAFTIEERDGKSVHVYKKDGGDDLIITVEADKNARAAGTRPSDREPPKGETWGPVKDHKSYADILSGPRNGWFVNLQQGSAREGDVFHIIKRGGKEFHVYGDGDKKTWVEVGGTKKKDAAAATTTGGAATTGTSTSGTATQGSGSTAATAGTATQGSGSTAATAGGTAA
jgi:hypothetical protein